MSATFRMVEAMDASAFEWLDPGELIDDDLELKLKECRPPDPMKGWVPCYVFSLRTSLHPKPVGEIQFRVGTEEKLRQFRTLGLRC